MRGEIAVTFHSFNLAFTLFNLFFLLLLHKLTTLQVWLPFPNCHCRRTTVRVALQRLPPPHNLKLVLGCLAKLLPCLADAGSEKAELASEGGPDPGGESRRAE